MIGQRRHRACSKMARTLLSGHFVDLATIQNRSAAEAALTDLVIRIEALKAEREDELLHPHNERDGAFLLKAKAALRRAGNSRVDLTQMIASYRQFEKVTRQNERATDPNQAFVDAARGILDRDTFLAIWARADRVTIPAKLSVDAGSEATSPGCA